jgi:hypothetical protein
MLLSLLLFVAVFQGFLGHLTSFWPMPSDRRLAIFRLQRESLIALQATLGAAFEGKGILLAWAYDLAARTGIEPVFQP